MLFIGYLVLLFYDVGGVLRQRDTYEGSGSVKVTAFFRMRPRRTRCTGLEHEQFTISMMNPKQVRFRTTPPAAVCRVFRWERRDFLFVGPSWIFCLWVPRGFVVGRAKIGSFAGAREEWILSHATLLQPFRSGYVISKRSDESR